MRKNVFFKKALSCGLALSMLALPVIPGRAETTNTNDSGIYSGTWFETAFALWEESDSDYSAFVRLSPGYNAYYWRDGSVINETDPNWDMANGWVAIDDELVRKVDENRGIKRVDVQGLPRGTYDIKVLNSNNEIAAKFTGLETTSFSRLGAAFVPSTELIGNSAQTNYAPYGATGGYLSDGRIDPNAVIMYVSHGNWDDFTIANLNRSSALRNGNPMVVRFIGTVGDFERVAATPAAAGAVLPPSAMTNNRMMTLQTNSHQLTFEGVGDDAVLYGWGVFTGGTVNFSYRNLKISNFFQQGLRASGNTTNLWAHNNTFYYGQNRFFFNDEPSDRTMGQGSLDIEQNVRGYTIAYNHFNGGRGTHLIVGGVQNVNLNNNVHRHYGTLHHNIYDNAQERNPRTRHHNLHMFNNLFRDVLGHPLHYRLLDRYTGYGIGAAHNATIWAEGNIFDEVGFPFLRSRHGHTRGYYPHTGHNHFFGDGPGFIVTGDNVRMDDGSSLGGLTIPEFGADLGYRNSFRGLSNLIEHADFVARVGQLQPNVMSDRPANSFNPNLDLGITVDEQAVQMTPPSLDVLFPQVGFPALNANAINHGWGFEGDFRPSTSYEDIWSTSTPDEVAYLRNHIENSAGVMQKLLLNAPITAPNNVTISLNEYEYFMHAQASPLPSLRPIVYSNTFTITWESQDSMSQSYEIEFFENGIWREVTTMERGFNNNRLITQDLTDFGGLVMQSEDFDWIAVHSGGNGLSILYPSAGFGHPDNPIYTEADIPNVSDLALTNRWVIGDTQNGGTYQFRVRAVNELGAGEWAYTSYDIKANSPRLNSIHQLDSVETLSATTAIFDLNFSGVQDGIYEVTLSVPRSMARTVVLPWPSQRNFTNAIRIPGTTNFGGNGPRVGNGGTGNIVVENGRATLEIDLNNSILTGIYDLMISVNIDGTTLSKPAALFVGEDLPIQDIIPSANVTQLQGNSNDLTVTVTYHLVNGRTIEISETFRIRNNASGYFEVGNHNVFVNTQGNTQIREIRIVD